MLDCTAVPALSDCLNGESRTEDFTVAATRIGEAGLRPIDFSVCSEACFSRRAVVFEVSDSLLAVCDLRPPMLPDVVSWSSSRLDGLLPCPEVAEGAEKEVEVAEGLAFLPEPRPLLKRRWECPAVGDGDLRFESRLEEAGIVEEPSLEGKVRGFSRIADDFVAHS